MTAAASLCCGRLLARPCVHTVAEVVHRMLAHQMPVGSLVAGMWAAQGAEHGEAVTREGHHPVFPATRGQKIIRHRRCGCDTKLCRDHCCAQCHKIAWAAPSQFSRGKRSVNRLQGLATGTGAPCPLVCCHSVMLAPLVRHLVRLSAQPRRASACLEVCASASPDSGSAVFEASAQFTGQYETPSLPLHGSRVGSRSRQSRRRAVFKVCSPSLLDSQCSHLALKPVFCGLPG